MNGMTISCCLIWKTIRYIFESADQFDWANAVIESDSRKDYGESRFMAYGLIEDRLYCLVFTPRGSKIRIISLRKANRREAKRYEN